MIENSTAQTTVLDVEFPGCPTHSIPVIHSPFLIGRKNDIENHLGLEDEHISSRCAAIVAGRGGYRLEDRGNRKGVFVNGQKVAHKILHDGDAITFGNGAGGTIRFRSSAGATTVHHMLNRMADLHSAPAPHEGAHAAANHGAHSNTHLSTHLSGGLKKLNLLLEATSLLHSHLPLDSVLSAMLDHAISITQADRGLLLEAVPGSALKPRLARDRSGASLPLESITTSHELLEHALKDEASVVVDDQEMEARERQSGVKVIHVHPHSFIAAPLYALPADDQPPSQHGELLGVIYLDSTHPAAFSELVRQIFDALAVEAASILENARHMAREHERRLMEHELGLARAIQQALLPRGFHDFPHLSATGINHPCIDVGGDYFDVFPISDDRTAVLIADVSGHGLGAALLTTMLQGALSGMSLGDNPVRVFNQINQFLCEHSEVGHYATMFFSLLDRNGELHYIKAAHPSPLLLRGGKVSELYTEGSFPVGLLPQATFTADSVQLSPGDTLVMFSDGVTEAENPEEEQFGVPRLCELLAGHENTPLDELEHIILDAVDSFCRGAAQLDDITVLLARYRTPA